MQQLFFLALIFATTQLFGQAPIHFLITSDQQVNITEPLCEDMIKETSALLEQAVKRVDKSIKKGTELTLAQKSQIEAYKTAAQNTQNEMPLFSLGSNLLGVYKYSLNEIETYLSLQQIQDPKLGQASIQITLSNINVSPSVTSMDISVRNPATNTPPTSSHFSIATGILLELIEGQMEARWYFYWEHFYWQTEIYAWLEGAIESQNPSIISPSKKMKKLNEPIESSKFMTATYLEKAKTDAQRILKEVPYPIPFDQINSILISQDESKIFFYTTTTDMNRWNQERYSDEQNWLFAKKDNHWILSKADTYNYNNNIENEADSLNWKINFYRIAFDQEQTPWSYKEEEWTQIVDQLTYETYNSIEFKHVISSQTNHQLIEQYIKPQLAKLSQQDTYTYNNFYQRQSPEFGGYSEDEYNIYTTIDFLISNPEQTAFIYPVLLHHKKDQERAYYYTNEDFKFYVLLKNSAGSYTLYDWHYFKTIPYKNYYNLTNCVESHLTNITEYNSGQEIINDTDFWNNYVFKNSARAYDYLIPMVAIDESIRISKNEFDAQVSDCIELIVQHDISDLHPNQLQQIIRCVNTIEKWNLLSSNNKKLLGLSEDLFLQNRINKVQENTNGYYPMLNLEFKSNLNPHSYYLVE